MKNLQKDILYQKYIIEQKTPYEISNELNVNHKTIRAYLKKYKIPLRTASEYNFLARKNYTKPSPEMLFSQKSIAAHTAYLCEGYHTVKANGLYFCNQDPALIDIILWCLNNVYNVKSFKIYVSCADKKLCSLFLNLYPTAKFQFDKLRKNPIIKIKSGGKMLVRDVVQNAYFILNSMK